MLGTDFSRCCQCRKAVRRPSDHTADGGRGEQEVRLFCSPGKSRLLRFALTAISRTEMIRFLETYWDFSAGPMSTIAESII